MTVVAGVGIGMERRAGGSICQAPRDGPSGMVADARDALLRQNALNLGGLPQASGWLA